MIDESLKFVQKYDLDYSNKLGQGAYGEVYKITEKSSGKIFALKTINVSKILLRNNNRNTESRFDKIKHKYIKEYHILELLKNEKNVVHYVEKFEIKIDDKFYLFIVMNLIKGKEFRKLYQCIRVERAKIFNNNLKLKDENKPITIEPKDIFIKPLLLLNYMIKFFEILSSLHEKGIAHRDIKLENAMFNKLNVTLIDFGFSCILKEKINDYKIIEEEKEKLTCKGELLGTPSYYSPEIISNDDVFPDVKMAMSSDVWATGIMFYRLAEAKVPFEGNSSDEINNKIVNKNVRMSYKHPGLKKIIKLCLTKDWNKRPSSTQILGMLKKIKIKN
jgi:serine/threonine protein kinase